MTNTSFDLAGESNRGIANIDPIEFTPALAVMGYPFLPTIFHAFVGLPGSQRPWVNSVGAAIVLLICAFAVPILGLAVACRSTLQKSMRCLSGGIRYGEADISLLQPE